MKKPFVIEISSHNDLNAKTNYNDHEVMFEIMS